MKGFSATITVLAVISATIIFIFLYSKTSQLNGMEITVNNGSIPSEFAPPIVNSSLNYIPGRLIVKLKEHKTIDDISNDNAKNNVTSSEKLIHGKAFADDLDRILVLHFNEHVDITKLLNAYRKNPNVEYATPDLLLQLRSVPNDPLYWTQWGLNNTGLNLTDFGGDQSNITGIPGDDISAGKAWDISTDGSLVPVAVIDSGVNYTNPDLGNCLGPSCPVIIAGHDSVDNTNIPFDTCGHGTHVAGIIGALGNNSIGVTGVDWKAKIAAIKIMGVSDPFGTYYNCGSALSIGIDGVSYAVSNGYKIISASWGYPGTFTDQQALYNTISDARDKGVLFVAAANDHAYGSNSDNTVEYGQSLSIDPKIKYNSTTLTVDNQTIPLFFWVYDSNSDGIYDSGDIMIDGELGYNLSFGSTLKYTDGLRAGDPFEKFVDSNNNGHWDLGEILVDDTSLSHIYKNPDSRIGGNDFPCRYSLSYTDPNTSTIYPGLDNVLCVTASDPADNRPYWANFGPNSILLAAPGWDIVSTMNSSDEYCSPVNCVSSYGALSGTSMATPMVSGAAALVWSRDTSLNYKDVTDFIKSGVDQKIGLAGSSITGGRLNLYNALINVIDFNVSVNPSSVNYTFGNPTNVDVKVDLVAGTGKIVSLTANCPSGITCDLIPNSGTPPFTSSLKITSTNSSISGTFPVTISANNRTVTRTVSFNLAVQPAPTFSLPNISLVTLLLIVISATSFVIIALHFVRKGGA